MCPQPARTWDEKCIMFGIETFHGFTGNKSNSIIGMVRPEWLSQIMKTSITIHSMFTRNPFITYHCAALYITSFNCHYCHGWNGMGDCHRLWKPQQPFLACLGEAHSLPTTVLPSCDFLLYRQNFCSSSYALFVLIKNHSLKKELHADHGSSNTPLVHSLKNECKSVIINELL